VEQFFVQLFEGGQVGDTVGVSSSYGLPFVIGRGGIHRSIRPTPVAIVIVNRCRRTDGGLAQCAAQITGSAAGVGPVSPRRRGRWIFTAAI